MKQTETEPYMKKVMLFGGTTEGRRVIELLETLGIVCYVSVATAYGSKVLETNPDHCRIMVGRMDATQIEDFLRQNSIPLVIDATHPYAVEVTANIQSACHACGVQYLRIVREQGRRPQNAVFFSDFDQIAAYLNEHEGNVLLTTGSKDLQRFTHITDFQNRVYARILPLEQSVKAALDAGYPQEHLICEKGPFSEQQNIDMIRQCNACCLVSKDTGDEGGFWQKAGAAEKTGALFLVVERPKESGITVAELEKYLQTYVREQEKT